MSFLCSGRPWHAGKAILPMYVSLYEAKDCYRDLGRGETNSRLLPVQAD